MQYRFKVVDDLLDTFDKLFLMMVSILVFISWLLDRKDPPIE